MSCQVTYLTEFLAKASMVNGEGLGCHDSGIRDGIIPKAGERTSLSPRQDHEIHPAPDGMLLGFPR